MLCTLFHPYDDAAQRPTFSENGKYVVRLYFNGCFRRVVIDDLLPARRASRAMHVLDRANPGLLWPALVEKAYLKVRGAGYNASGSNSATDVCILTGWIPEQLYLRRFGPDLHAFCKNIYNFALHFSVPPLSYLSRRNGRVSVLKFC